MDEYFEVKIADVENVTEYQGTVYEKDVTLESSNGEQIRVCDKNAITKNTDIGKTVNVKIKLVLYGESGSRKDEPDIKDISGEGSHWHLQVAGKPLDADEKVILENSFGKFIIPKPDLFSNLEAEKFEDIAGKEIVIQARPDLEELKQQTGKNFLTSLKQKLF